MEEKDLEKKMAKFLFRANFFFIKKYSFKKKSSFQKMAKDIFNLFFDSDFNKQNTNLHKFSLRKINVGKLWQKENDIFF